MAAYPTNAKDSAESPAKNAFAITPHATNEVGAYVPRSIYVGSAGDITMRLVGDVADTVFVGVLAGSVLPVRPLYIRATGTTASSILGLY
jgi:hypothetical protein